MPRRLYTVADLVLAVRRQTDEANVDSLDDAQDIIPCLNRGLDYAGSVLAKRYPDPFLKQAAIPLIALQQEYDIPEDCFEDRILKVELNVNNTFYDLRRVSFYDVGRADGGTATDPSIYAIVGRSIRISPASSGIHSLRIWYFRQPEELVAPQGRITAINPVGNYFIVDVPGADLSTESDTLESYINIIDGQTGVVKCTGQIQQLQDSRITIRTLPTRTTVLNRTVATTLPDTIGLDDYVCNVRGTCVPEFSQPLSNFLIQYAVAEIARKLGGDAPTEAQVLEKFEKQVSGSWSGREGTTRIKARSPSLTSYRGGRRRWPITQRNS